MKSYIVKYETDTGDVKIVSLMGYDKQHAIDKLVDYRQIYWIKLKGTEENLL